MNATKTAIPNKSSYITNVRAIHYNHVHTTDPLHGEGDTNEKTHTPNLQAPSASSVSAFTRVSKQNMPVEIWLGARRTHCERCTTPHNTNNMSRICWQRATMDASNFIMHQEHRRVPPSNASWPPVISWL